MKLTQLTNSDRPGHLFAAGIVGAVIAVYNLPLGASVLFWEWFATPDMDITTRRPRRLVGWLWVTFWRPWSVCVSHRSMFSHSLLFGTPCRLAYVLAAPAFLLMFPHSIFHWIWEGHQGLVFRVLETVVMGAVIADTVHLFKDGYGFIKLFIGE